MIHKFFAILFVLCVVQNVIGGGRKGGDVMKCDGGDVNCCNERIKKDDPSAQGIVGLLNIIGVNLDKIIGDIGLQCTPVAAGVLGGAVSGVSCSQQTVCCKGNHFSGFINVGCLPFNVNAG